MVKRKRGKDKQFSTKHHTEIKYWAGKTLILSSLKYIRGTWLSKLGLFSHKTSSICQRNYSYGIHVFGSHLWHISYCTYSIVNTSCQLIVNHVLGAKEVIGNHKSISWRTDNVMVFENSAFETARVSREVVVQLFLSQSDLLL